MKKIAIIGAGFCGLAVAWHLLQKNPKFSISIYDAEGIGAGASGIATGLLHPFGGAHAKLNRLGKEGLKATQEMLLISSEALGIQVFYEKGILRQALDEYQFQDFTLCAKNYPGEVAWQTAEQCRELYPYLCKAPGLWIKKALAVDTPLYLAGLGKACENLGSEIFRKKIQSLSELEGYDHIVIASGGDTIHFPEMAKYPLSVVKGQILELYWPDQLPPLSFALNSYAYLLMNEKEKSCIVGATYERDFISAESDLERAAKEIMPKAIAMIPQLIKAEIKRSVAGLRVVTPTHLPLVERVNDKTWVITGMGSKGLLYHALSAKNLADRIG